MQGFYSPYAQANFALAGWAQYTVEDEEPIYEEMLADLVARGYRVTFKHFRWPIERVDLDICLGYDVLTSRYAICPALYSRGNGWYHPEWWYAGVNPRGGTTECVVSGADGTTIVWEHCSDKDNFCYRVGRELALRQVYKALQEAE